jgi:hypothetical protein
MVRIRIENLPTVENLTQDELEQIFGAGLRSFKPTFDALENRALMTAGLRGAVVPTLVAPSNPATPNVAHVREINPVIANRANVDMSKMFDVETDKGPPRGTLLQGTQNQGWSPKQDVATVKEQGTRFLKDFVIEDYNKNRWMLRTELLECTKTEVIGNDIKLTFRVNYYQLNTNFCRVELTFTKVRHYGFETLYGLKSAGLHDFEKKTAFGDAGAFEGVAKTLFKNKYGDHITIHNYDEAAVGKSLTAAVQQLGNLGKFDFDGAEGREGGLRVWAKLADGTRVEMSFDYHGREGTQHVFKLVDVARFQWNGYQWNKLDLGGINGDQLKAGNYRV